jgi:hypothetical protein
VNFSEAGGDAEFGAGDLDLAQAHCVRGETQAAIEHGLVEPGQRVGGGQPERVELPRNGVASQLPMHARNGRRRQRSEQPQLGCGISARQGVSQRSHHAAEQGQRGAEPTTRRLRDTKEPGRRRRLGQSTTAGRECNSFFKRRDGGAGRSVERCPFTLR